MRRDLDRLLCIFPFEQAWFRKRGVRADYIGHPLTYLLKPNSSRTEFLRKHQLDGTRPLVALLPGSRVGEVSRHLPLVTEAIRIIQERMAVSAVLATPARFSERTGGAKFWERLTDSHIQIIEGETTDTIACSDLAIAASGTVTVEAALLGTPMVTFYRVSNLSWTLGRRLVRVPFLTMVNLVAGRKVVPELMQEEATGAAIAQEAVRLLEDQDARERMKVDLLTVTAQLRTDSNPIQNATDIVSEFLTRK
jgi:lipid-A-disaccharide synthase